MVDVMEILTKDIVLVAIVSLLSGIVVTYLSAILKFRKDLQTKYDIDLRNERIKVFKTLWTNLEPLAKYSPAEQVTYLKVQFLSTQLRQWYFEEGGLYLTNASRKTYFALQGEIGNSLRQALQSRIKEKTKEDKTRLLEMVQKDIGKDVGITVADLESQSKKVSDDSIDKIINYTLGSVYLQMSILEGIENERLEEKMLEMIKERSSDLRTSLANDIGSRRNPEIGQSWRVNLRKLSKPSK